MFPYKNKFNTPKKNERKDQQKTWKTQTSTYYSEKLAFEITRENWENKTKKQGSIIK